ncbi:Uncharacterized conserved protein, DUF427 family [Lentzea waywayandensis]|uniref:Uncharacterized conserved protein, DUF427 family n=1 Tax=Lentzea waywayandensis TaxID=84724 RepID=A0A1I6FID3_9PSEU|nr:DUF427 domain-containing protein [Lentzea waywayandensis]SFR29701.1 Uncharacterized conserved protein, DUF427 family [Lentzea waywayandensis]
MGDNERGRVRVEQSAKRVRAYFGGELVVDATSPRLVWEVPYYPAYYLPLSAVRVELKPTGETKHSPSRGEGVLHDVITPGGTASAAALTYPDSPIEELRDLVRFEFAAMDEWLEEDEPIYVHPRDPYKRVDVLSSSRHVRVALDGVTLAASSQPRILFETSLPPRYYLPLSDVRFDLLRPSDTRTQCPYKGTAAYWSVEVNGVTHEDLVWIYREPLPESQKVAGMACFFSEKVDLFVDGEPQQKPKTPWS